MAYKSPQLEESASMKALKLERIWLSCSVTMSRDILTEKRDIDHFITGSKRAFSTFCIAKVLLLSKCYR